MSDIEAIRARLAAAGPSERWSMMRRDGAFPEGPPVAGDSDSNLGWDWSGDDPPPEPLRGVFALGADAAFVHHAHADIAYLLAEIDRRTIERDAAEALAAASKHPHHGVTKANRAKWRGEIADLRAKLASAERTAQDWAERATLLERELAATQVKLADREGV